MISFILDYGAKSKNFAIGIIGVLLLLFIVSFVDNYFEAQDKIEEYKRIEEEAKVFHEENIVKLKETLKIRDNAKKIDFNDTGNLDDDFLLKSLE
jgi:hypothetical protein